MGIRQVVKVSSFEANEFLSLVEKLLNKGGKLMRIAPFFSLPYEAQFEIIDGETIEDRPGITVFVREVFVTEADKGKYTREDLEKMDWELFRTFCKGFGIKGRERSVMIDQYLALTE